MFRSSGALLESLERRLQLASGPVTPHLLKDIGTMKLAAGGFADLGGIAIFAASDPTAGREVWRSDGTAAGTYRVTDLIPGTKGSNPRNFTRLDDRMIFVADDATAAGRYRLYSTDGTAGGTHAVAPTAYAYGAIAASDQYVYFAGVNGTSGIFRTDGSGNAPTPVLSGVVVGAMRRVGDNVYFTAGSSYSALHLYRIDAAAPDRAVALTSAIVPDFGEGVPQPVAFDGRVYFWATDDAGTELWSSDGTPRGTARFLDVVPGPAGGYNGTLATLDDKLIFQGGADGAHAIYVSDGTPAGTTAIHVNQFFADLGLAVVGKRAFFTVGDASVPGYDNAELWVTDGTPDGTGRVTDLSPGPRGAHPGSLTPYGDRLVFTADDGMTGRELWTSDGTAAGTHLISDLWPGTSASNPTEDAGQLYFNSYTSLGVIGDRIVFAADDPFAGSGLWYSDGTGDGTYEVPRVALDPTASGPTGFVRAGGLTYFVADDGAHGRELWTTDGTSGRGTRMVGDLLVGRDSAFPGYLTPCADQLFFAANSSTNPAYSAYLTDGTAAGTRLLRNAAGVVQVMSNSFRPVVHKGYVYFPGWQSSGSQGIWRTDGTPEGTRLVAPFDDRSIGALTPSGNALFFEASLQSNGAELFRVDDDTGTLTAFDLWVGGDAKPRWLADLNGTLFFAAEVDDSNSVHLFRISGTDLTAKPVAFNALRDPGPLVVLNGYAYTFALSTATWSLGLWRSDGSEVGTVEVDQTPNLSYFAQTLTVARGALWFAATDAVSGNEPWVSDGTPGGTRRVKDIVPGAGSGIDQLGPFVAHGDAVYFRADDATGGNELWRSDGTGAGTWRVADLSPGTGWSFPDELYDAGGALYFSAATPAGGREVWQVDAVPPVALSATFEPTAAAGIATARIRFSEDVQGTLAAGDLQVENLTSGQTLAGSALALAYDANRQVASLTFPGYPAGLPDGNYRVTLPAGSVADPAGNLLASPFVFDFFALAGDANRDRSVDFNDLVKLAQNYNTTGGKTYADGDFTGDGNVDFKDLVILAQHYNTRLQAPGATVAPAASAPSFAADWSTATALVASPTTHPERKKAKPKPVFSVTPVVKPAPAKSKTPPPRRK